MTLETEDAYAYLCEFHDTTQWYIPLMDSTAVLNDNVHGSAIADKEGPRGGRGVCSALAIRNLIHAILGLNTQSAHPWDLRMKKAVHSLIQTKGVLTAKQIGSVT